MQGKALLGETERKGYERKLQDWRAEGFDVGRLMGILRDSPQEAPGAFETAEKGIHRNRMLLGEFQAIRTGQSEEQIAKMQKLLKDPWSSREAENLLLEMHVRAERARKEEQRKKRESERRVARLRERVAAWKADGFGTAALEEALGGDPEAAESEVERFAEGVSRLLACEEELGALEGSSFAEERERIRGMLRDTARAQEAEEAIIRLRVRIEKRKSEERLRAGQEKLARAALRDRVAAWRASGLKVPLADDFIENADLDMLNERMEELEEAVARLSELREDFELLPTDENAAERKALRELLQDPTQVPAAEERLLRLQFASQRAARERERKAEESRRWRQDLLSRVTELKGAGYDTSRMDSAFEGDDEILSKEWVKYRIQLKRVQEVEKELRSLPSEGFEKDIGALVAELRKVGPESTDRVVAGKRSIEEKIAARREAELRAREAEERERRELTTRLMGWVAEGYRDGREGGLEAVGSLPLQELRSELGVIERRILTVEQMRRDIMSLDISGFETESAVLLEELYDLSRIEAVGPRTEELRGRILAKRDEERRRDEEGRRKREEFRSKIAGWKKLGFEVSALEALLDGDLDFLRTEYARARMDIQRAQSLLGELAAIPAAEAGPEHAEIRRALYGLERLDESAEHIERLRLSTLEKGRLRKKLEELQGKVREWKEQGYDVSRLERLGDGDVEALTKEFLMFKIRVQKLKEYEEELGLLDTGGFEAERARIERNLKNVDAVGDIRDLLSELELKIGKRMAEEVRLREERRRLQGEQIARMTAWLEEGFHVDVLEGALGKEPGEMAAAFDRFEKSVKEARQWRERLEELEGFGHDELIARIREKLRDVGRIDEARKDIRELWEKIEQRKKESESRRREDDDLRFGIVRQIEAWEAEGYDVGELQKLAGGRLEDLRRAMITHRISIERMQGLQGILDAMETRHFETEAAGIRAQLKDLLRVDEVEAAIAALKDKIRDRREKDRTAREEQHKKRDACTDRFLAMLAQGYNVDTLEGALDLPYEALYAECGRLEGVVARLREIGAELDRRGMLAGNEGARRRLFDLHALPDLEEYLSTGKAPWDQRAAPDRIPIIRYGHGRPAGEPAAPGREPAPELPELKPPEPRRALPPPPPAEGAAPAPAGEPVTPEGELPGPPERPLAPEETAPGRPESPQEPEEASPARPERRPEAEAGGPPEAPAGPAPEGPLPSPRAAPSLAAAVTGAARADAGTVTAPEGPGGPAGPAVPAELPTAEKCGGCGEPLEPSWKKCPSCLRPVAPPEARRPEPARQPQYDRIPARPEKDLGIREAAPPEWRERARREAPLDPEKLTALRDMIDREKAKGVDVGDIEDYLNSGVVTKEGLRTRLEAIRRMSKELDAGPRAGPDTGPSPPAGPSAPATGEPPAEESPPEGAPPSGGEPGGTEGPAPGEPASDGEPPEQEAGERPPADANGDAGGGNGGQPGEGVRKIRKVKKVVR